MHGCLSGLRATMEAKCKEAKSKTGRPLGSVFPPTVNTIPMRCRPALTRLRAASVLLVGVLLCFPRLGHGQETPEIEGTISVSTDAGGSETLPFGMDPGATAGVDSLFGESELPPPPPSGVFDARWVDDVVEASFGQGLPVDIRQGSSSSTGTRQHKVRFQTEDAATEVTIEWDLPEDVTGTIEVAGDSVEMTGTGSLTASPGDPHALLTIDYNTAPTLDTNEGTTLEEGGQVTIPTDSLSASDPDHDSSELTFDVTDGPTEGDLLVSGTEATEFTQQDLIDENVTYDHTAGIAPGDTPPDDAFTFDLQDGKGEGPTGNVFSVSVLETNDPPTATSDTDTTQQGTAISVSAPGVLGNDSDPNGDQLSVSAVNGNAPDVGQEITLASGALLTVETDGSYDYDPNGAFSSLAGGETDSDSFTYTAGDGNGGTDQAAVTLTIEGLNGAPVAADDSFSTYEDSTLTVGAPGVLGNDDDPDGDPLTSTVGAAPSNGTLTLSNDGSFEYVPAPGFTGTDSFTYTAGDGNGGTDQATVTLAVTGTQALNLDSGWNLVSLPYQMEDQTFGAVLPTCTSGFRYTPSSGNQLISDGDTLTVGQGFWAKCPPGTEQVVGTGGGSQTVGVAAGWNLVGPFGDSTDAGSISSDPQGIVASSFYGFDPSDGYTPVSTLAPGEGYWVNASASGTLALGGGGEGSSLAAQARLQNGPQNGSEDGATVSLHVTDDEGREATLWLRRGRPASKQNTSEQKRRTLPPVPPGATFDVRFANGSALATVEPGGGASFRDVKLQGAAYPLTLRLEGGPRAGEVLLRQGRGPGADVRALASSAPSATLQEGSGPLQVGLRALPEQYALHRSAPNPASGPATISFSVPEQTRVEIGVFDVLGRKIATLAEGQKEPGRHDVRLDAGALPSGTYFYRMSAEGFSETRRLEVIR